MKAQGEYWWYGTDTEPDAQTTCTVEVTHDAWIPFGFGPPQPEAPRKPPPFIGSRGR